MDVSLQTRERSEQQVEMVLLQANHEAEFTKRHEDIFASNFQFRNRLAIARTFVSVAHDIPQYPTVSRAIHTLWVLVSSTPFLQWLQRANNRGSFPDISSDLHTT